MSQRRNPAIWWTDWSVGISPDGGQIVSGGEDGTVRVWDVALGEEVSRLAGITTGHTYWVISVGFSPDTPEGTGGGQIVSGGEDGTVRVWPADLEALLALADSLIQRDPPIFVGDERIRFGFEGPNRAKAH